MRKLLFSAAVMLATMAFAAPAMANGFNAKPFEFVGGPAQGCPTPGTPGGVSANWKKGFGAPGGDAKQYGLVLTKNVPTTDCSASGAIMQGENGLTLTELGFDYSGYCGGGAPRFNVQLTDGKRFFFGCSAGTHTPTTGGFTRVRFTNADASPANGTDVWPGFGTAVVKRVDIIQDEQGNVVLDNIDLSGTLTKKPE